MNIQAELVSHIIQKQTLKDVLERKIEPYMFTDEQPRQVFDGVMSFYQKYKQIPTIEWVEHEYPDFRVVFAKQPQSYYIDELMKTYVKKEAQEFLIQKSAGIYQDPFETMAEIRARMTQLSLQAEPTKDVDGKDSADDRYDAYKNRKESGGMDGISTPWNTLNDATGGIHEGEFWIFAGRPGSTKTWQLLKLSEHLYTEEKKSVMLITYEMTDEELFRRWDAVKFKLPFKMFKSGMLTDAREKMFKDGLADMKKDNHFIKVISGQGLGVNAISQKIEQYNPDVVMIDGIYMTLDDRKGKDIWSRTTNVSRDTKQMALHYKKPVIATTQLNRGVSEKSEEVGLGNLGFSDAYGQDANNVIGLIRTKDMELNHEVQFDTLKSRDGETPRFRTETNLETMSFSDLNEVIKERYEAEEDEINY